MLGRLVSEPIKRILFVDPAFKWINYTFTHFSKHSLFVQFLKATVYVTTWQYEFYSAIRMGGAGEGTQ
jgi:hypothetical protein